MNDIDIARSCVKDDITEIAKKLGIDSDDLILYGKYKAKINIDNHMESKKGKLVLVTATNPTPFGEGKTTVTIGLLDALNHIGVKAVGALREPSLGPVFGLKGGATGGGYSQVVPMEDINLHFTGDLHAISSANNLISAAIDNHIFNGNELRIDPNQIIFRRCLDVNDRSLRRITTEVTKELNVNTAFDITAASEVMTTFCLSKDLEELKYNLGNIMVAKNMEGRPVFARDLKLEGSLTVLLKDAFNPNLVQTLEKNPVIIHGGPFANIAHGCNSLVATNLALSLGDYVITEAGFGSDLGAEKFFDIKCRKGNLKPDCVVLTTTIRALKYNGGCPKEEVQDVNIGYLTDGLPNLTAHIENLKKFTSHLIVCINKFDTDTLEEVDLVKKHCESLGVDVSLSEAYLKGGIGALSLADKVRNMCEKENDFHFLYDESLPIANKIDIICKEIYHAGSIKYTEEAIRALEFINNTDNHDLPICIAKTQYSLSDDPKKLGYPKDYEVIVRNIELHTGSGFIVVYLGSILTMPGLPKKPNYEQIDIDDEGNIVGIF